MTKPDEALLMAAEATGDFYCEAEQVRSALKCQSPCADCWSKFKVSTDKLDERPADDDAEGWLKIAREKSLKRHRIIAADSFDALLPEEGGPLLDEVQVSNSMEHAFQKACAAFEKRTPSATRWIPVSERLPEHKGLMLCCGDLAVGMERVRPGYYDHDEKTWWMQCGGNSWDASDPTHWMPLPDSPRYVGRES